MFFLLRCAFWLGLTFSMMTWPGGTPALPDAGALARAATGELVAACTAAPQTCLDGARKLEALRTLAAPAAIQPQAQPAAATNANSPRMPAKPAAGSLRTTDMQPAWRGRG